MKHDLAVIGTGTAAMVAATRVRSAGWDVAVIDEKSYGGTCALRGCDPKKMLIAGTEVVDGFNRMEAHGVTGAVGIDWRQLLAFKRSFTDPVPEKHEARYHVREIATYHGETTFTGPNSLLVAGTELESRFILIASGAEPLRLSIPGEGHLLTNEDFLAMETLPRRIVLVGGGYIAAEFPTLQRGPERK